MPSGGQTRTYGPEADLNFGSLGNLRGLVGDLNCDRVTDPEWGGKKHLNYYRCPPLRWTSHVASTLSAMGGEGEDFELVHGN